MRNFPGKIPAIGIALCALMAPAAFAGTDQGTVDQSAPLARNVPLRLAQNTMPPAVDPTVGQDPAAQPPGAAAQPGMPMPTAEIPKPTHGSVGLEAGSGKILTLTLPAANIYVADPKVAEVRPASSTSLFVFGVGAGRTTIAAVDVLGRLLADYDITVKPSAFSAREAQATISQLIPGSKVRVRPQGKGLILTGGVANAADAAQAMTIAKGYMGADGIAVDNQMSIVAPTQVTLMVRIAEMKRSVVRTLGIDWSAGGFFGKIAPLTGAGAGAALLQSSFNNFTCTQGRLCFDAVLNALAKDGLAHILAEPNLTVMSGQAASFQAGGEYPIPVSAGNNSNQVTVTYKNYGVLLNFVPTVMGDGRINLHVRPEVSQIDTTNTATAPGAAGTLVIPALTVRRAETTVELGSGESLAIAGMLQTLSADGNAGIPGLGEAPFLGALFNKNNMTREQTELVIIVTPLLVRPVRNVAQLQLPAEGYKPAGDFDRLLRFRQVPNADGTAAPKSPGAAGFIVR